jgi:hypothetical protein
MELIFSFHAADSLENLAIHCVDCLLNAFAEVALSAVAQFNGLMRASRCARWHSGAAYRPILEDDVYFHRWIAAAVEYFTANDVNDGGHGELPYFEGTSLSVNRLERNAAWNRILRLAGAESAFGGRIFGQSGKRSVVQDGRNLHVAPVFEDLAALDHDFLFLHSGAAQIVKGLFRTSNSELDRIFEALGRRCRYFSDACNGHRRSA